MYLGQVTLRGLLGASIRKTLQHVGVLFVCFVGILFFAPTLAFAQVTLSGTVFSDVGVTADETARTISVAVGTSTPGVFSTTSSVTTGAWTVTIPAGHNISTSTPILVWIEGDVTARGQVLTKASTSAGVASITGLDIYRDRVIVRHEAISGTSTTLADFSFYTSANDADVQHSTSTGLLTISAGQELYVWPGRTFAPGSAVTVLGNSTASTTDGSMFLAGTSVYSAGGTLTLGGSLTAVSTATFTGGFFTTFFNATTTGKIIDAPIPSIGNVTFSGTGGAWTFTNAATTSALAILHGTVVAPTSTLGVTGTFQNDGIFTTTVGTVNIVGAGSVTLADIAIFANGRDVSGSAGGLLSQNITSFALSGNALYVGQAGVATGCSQTAGSAQGCELLVFNVASTSNPVFVAGRDSSGSVAGTSTMSVVSLLVRGTTLYVAKTASGAGCSQTAGLAAGCELIVFSISSTTDPIFVGGRDADGTLAGTTNLAATGLAVSGNALYLSKTLSGTTNCSTTASNCELLVFNIASSTDPQYVYGIDASGSNTGLLSVAVNSIAVAGNALYVAKAGLGTTCSQTAGGAQGCELMVFSLASTTQPLYVRGFDVNSSQTGTGNLAINTLLASGTALYLGTAASSSICSQTTGLAGGCELQKYSIASTTNPVFAQGVDVAGSYTGMQSLGVNNFSLAGNYLYAVRAGNATPCSQTPGFTLGCELIVFDVASSAMRLLASRDADGSATGTTATAGNAVITVGNSVIMGKAAAGTTACSTARLNCELMIFSASTTPSGLLFGTMTGTSSLGNLSVRGQVEFRDTASVNDITIVNGTTTAPSTLTVGGNYTNNGIYLANEGTLLFSSTSDQSVSGTLVGTSSFYRTVFSGGGTKTFTTVASTSFLTIDSGVTVVAPAQLTVSDTFTNNGAYSANNGTLDTNGFLNGFLMGLSVGGNATDTVGLAFNAFVQKDNIVYAVKNGNATPCTQVAGTAVGCELMAFDISSTTNPVYVAGRDVDGSNTGSGNIAILDVAVVGNSLYIAKAAAGTAACANTAGAGAAACELMVFNISSPASPLYTKGLDATGSNAGTSTLAINRLLVASSSLYAVKAASSTACNQTAGLAGGCELMAFDIASTTDPVFAAGRDADGTAAGTSTVSGTGLAISSSTLYMSKTAAGAVACTTRANCELMVFNVSSPLSPAYVTGIDASGSAAGNQSVTVNNIAVSGSALYMVKVGGGTACSNVAGGAAAASCELMVFDISSTTNVVYRAGVDVTASTNTGSGSQSINSVIATGSVVYVVKSGTAAACSQISGSALGCEVLVFDASSSTNPVYKGGIDANGTRTGQTATVGQAIFIARDNLMIGKALETTVCELGIGLRSGCEFLMYKLPTTLTGILTGASGLATVTTNGLTKIESAASTTKLTIAANSKFTAPTTSLSASANVTIAGSFIHNNGNFILNGNNQLMSAVATTTFYDFTQIATGAATTTFSTSSPFVMLRNLTLQGAATATPLRLRSTNSGIRWRIDPQSSTTLSLGLLDVQDSNNISATATPLVCGAGCLDSGNNLNWTVGLIVTISGTLFSEDGVTTYATATPLRLVIPTVTPYFGNATSATTTGTYSFSVADQFLVAGNPYIVFADNSTAIKANTIIKSNISGASVSGLDLFRNHVIVQSQSTSTPLTNADLFKYTSTDDADIQYTVDSGFGLRVASPSALVIADDSSFVPGSTVTVAGTATTTPTVGSFYLRDGAHYTPKNKTTLAGSFRASSTATYSPELAILEFNATTTGKTIDSELSTLGNVLFNGTGGAWSFTQANATTSDFDIEQGSVTAPSGELSVNGLYTNNATFNNNNGTLRAVGNVDVENARAATFVTGIDNNGSKSGTRGDNNEAVFISGDYMYVGQSDSPSSCSQVAGDNGVVGCEIKIYDISSSTNPIYIAGRDAFGAATGTANQDVFDVVVKDNYLFVAKTSATTTCSQVAGLAEGCELLVFDVSNPANPIYVAGRDVDGSATGVGAAVAYALDVSGNSLYLSTEGNATACSQVAGSAIGCELKVFNISNPANPIYVAGRDTDGSSAGVTSKRTRDLFVFGTTLYMAKDGDNTLACTQTAGSAVGCELIYFNISSSTNPVFAGGRDGEGSSNGTQLREIYSVHAENETLVIGKEGGFSACVQDGLNAIGCEIILFDISSTTNPIFTAGRDVDGSSLGETQQTVTTVRIHGHNLYVGKGATTTPCMQGEGSAFGCELLVFDLSSTTNPTLVAARDSDGDVDGVGGSSVGDITAKGSDLYVVKSASTVNCSQSLSSSGAIGCELQVFKSFQPAGIVSGNLTAGNSLSTLETQNITELAANASTTNITIATSSLLTSQNVSLLGDFSNSGTYLSVDATTFLASSSATQNFTGTASSSSTFGDLIFSGSGTKNVDLNATTTDLTALSGTSINYSGSLSIEAKYTNNGTVIAGETSELILSGSSPLNNYIAGRDVSGSVGGAVSLQLDQMIRRGDYLYIGKGFSAIACSQTVGSGQGCELQVYDVSSSTNPVFVAGRDASGDSTGTGAEAISNFVIKDNFLIVTKDSDPTACSQTAGSAIGCELMVFDISSSTNPIYVAGRDASGNNAGTGDVNMEGIKIIGDYAFITKLGNATACSQTAGSAIGCELMVFDISSSTNPIYVAGRDASGNNAGTGSIEVRGISIDSSYLYITKGGDPTACSQTAGSAIGCELMVFDISSSTNPIYVAGRDASGDDVGVGSNLINQISIKEDALFAVTVANATACSQTAGSAIGCELMVFDISSSTNPIYVAGRDASGSSVGTGVVTVRDINVNSQNLYLAKEGDATACSQTAGSAIGCELMVFDISSSTNPIYVAGRDASGSSVGTGNVIMRDVYTYANNLYVTKVGDATACSQVAGSAAGCELMAFNTGSILQGYMIGTSAHQAVRVTGPAEWYHNASTSDLTIGSAGIATVPPELSLAGDFSNSGQFNANNGTITLIGADQRLTSSATTTFNNLIQVATTSATTSFSSTGGFVSTGMLQLQGTSTNRLKLRSVVDGAAWTILPLGTASTSYLDVKDSRNSSTTLIECIDNCIDRGGNTNWLFFSALGTGTSTLAQHTAGQVSNKFGAASTTNETLLAFRLETNSGSTTYQSLMFDLTGVSGIDTNAISNFRLVYDKNNNRVFDGGDVLVGGTGDVVGAGQNGTVGFYEPFTATTSQNYLVIADWSPLNNGSFFTIGISPSSINATDSTGAQTVLGSIISVQHSRNNRGAGGGSASIGGAAPAGDGDVGGGNTTGGELIGSDPDFFGPSSDSGSWNNGAFAYDGVDGTYATTSSAVNHDYQNHGFSIPTNNTVGGIVVKLELSGTTAAGNVDVQLSWDGGTSWTSTKSSGTLTTTDAVRTLGSPSDLWGRSWSPGEFSNANFAVRVAGLPSSNTIRLDAIQVRVYHVSGGGGSGGGGGGGGI